MQVLQKPVNLTSIYLNWNFPVGPIFRTITLNTVYKLTLPLIIFLSNSINTVIR
jgi:hypothetical protein